MSAFKMILLAAATTLSVATAAHADVQRFGNGGFVMLPSSDGTYVNRPTPWMVPTFKGPQG